MPSAIEDMIEDMVIGALAIKVERKDIKHLHVSVLPPVGQVRVAAPKTMTSTAVRMAVIHRIPWIRKQQAHFAKQDRQSARQMVSGETHYLWGRRYRLEVIDHNDAKHAQSPKKCQNNLIIQTTKKISHSVQLKNGRLVLYVSSSTSTENKVKLLNEYYRTRLKARIPKLIDKWADKVGVDVTGWQVQKMKTKWGSCNIEQGRILLNLELAKKPFDCLEYIIVHELIHFKERHHNDRFKALLDTHLPDWRSRRQLLNEMPLSEENWKSYE